MDYEFVSGELFSKIADVCIYERNYLVDFPNIKNSCNNIIYNNEPINYVSLSIINKSYTFFCKTDHLNFFIINFLQLIQKKFLLITNNFNLQSEKKSVIYTMNI